jgi:ASC-1-like (ASCH) protein
MDHIVILKASWNLMEQIQVGTKSAEARWTKTKKHPWDAIQSGDNIFFMNYGGPIEARAKVIYVKQYKLKWDNQAKEIFKENEVFLLGTAPRILDIIKNSLGKKYCIIVYFMDNRAVRPFFIDPKLIRRTSTWVSVKKIRNCKI